MTFDQVDAARLLIKPQPLPQRKGHKIVFDPDDTPADAERRSGLAQPTQPLGPGNRKKPGPVPKSASAQRRAGQASLAAARAAITPYGPDPSSGAAIPMSAGGPAGATPIGRMPAFAKTTAIKAAGSPGRLAINGTDDNTSPTGPVLPDDEMDQIVRLVQDKYGPILDITQAAEVSKLAKQTIRERVCYGMYAESVVRGRPLRFWAHRFVKEVMRP